MNLGAALSALDDLGTGTAHLEEAVIILRAAQQEVTRGRAPLYWAVAQHNLGIALTILGEREHDRARVEEAVAAYREVLEEWTRGRCPTRLGASPDQSGPCVVHF